MTIDNIKDLIKTMSSSNVASLDYEEGNIKISLKKESVSPQTVVTTVGQQNVTTAVEVNALQDTEEILEGKIVTSPLVGTVYLASGEGAEVFANVGDTVKKGQTLAIVEAMKLMNEIESEFDGVIEEVYVENAQAVEYGQPLFKIS